MNSSIWTNLWKHPKTTIWGFLIGLLTVTGVLSQQGVTLGHAGTGTVVALIGALASALLGMLAQDPSTSSGSSTGSTGTRLAMVLLVAACLLIFAPACHAQSTAPTSAAPTATSTSNGFAGSSEAVALHYDGAWSAGTLVTESYDFLDFGAKKANHLYVEGHELLAPTPAFNVYAGGVKIEPDLSGLLNKTNVQAGSFGAFFTGSVGNGVPSSGGSHISWMAGGGVKYNLTSSLTWQTLQAQYGSFGANRFAVVSTGLSFIFGGK